MAAITHIRGAAPTANQEVYSDSAFTPSADMLLIVAAAATGTVDDATMTSDSTGLTFTLIGRATKNSTADSIYLFVADALTTGAEEHLVFDCTGDAATGAIRLTGQVSGMTKVGAAAVRQFKLLSDQAASGTPAVTFDAACLTSNPTLGVLSSETNPPATEPTSWTDLSTRFYSTPNTSCQYVGRDSGFTGTTITWASTAPTEFGAIIAEFDASVGGVTGTAAQTLPSITQAASGTTTSLASGTAAQALPSLTQAASGTETITGTAAQALPSLTQAATGTALVNATGTVAQILPGLRQEIVGVVTNPFVAAAVTPAPTLQGGAGRWAEAEFEGFKAQRRARMRELEQRERERDQLKEKIAAESRRAASKKRQLPERAAKLARYDRQVAAADAAIAVALAEIARLETELAARNSMIADRRRRLMLVALTAA